MTLSATIIDSPFDLIIGRPDILKHDLTLKLRSHFTLPTNVADSNSDQLTQNVSGMQSKAFLNSLNVLLTKDFKAPIPLDSSNDGNVSKAPIPGVFGLNTIEAALNDISTIYRKEDLIDVIDDDTDDLFWKEDITSLLPDDLHSESTKIDLPVIDGDKPFHQKIKNILQEYADVFSRSVSATPAKIPPMEIQIDILKWQTNAHRGPPRPQTPAKQ